MTPRASIPQRSGALTGSVCTCLAVLVLFAGVAAAGEEDSSCDDVLFDPITVSMSEVSGIEALEMVVRTTGMTLDLQTEVEGNVELAEEYKLGLDVLDEIAAQLNLEWTQYGCRIIVAAPGGLKIPEADTGDTKAD